MQEFVTETLSGQTEEELNCILENYFREYPKAGYATEILQFPTDLGGSWWEAKVRRYASCE